MITQVESFPYSDEQGSPEESRRIQQSKLCFTASNNIEEDNNQKN